MAVTDWIQPGDMFVNVPRTIQYVRAYRNVMWDTEGMDADALVAARNFYWNKVVRSGSSEFAGLPSPATTINESVSHDAADKYVAFNTSLPDSQQSYITLMRVTAGDPYSFPLFTPSLEPGQTVEYEAEAGVYGGTFRYGVGTRVVGTFSAANPLPRLLIKDNPLLSPWEGSDYPLPGAELDTWDDLVGLTAPFSINEVVRDASVVGITVLYPSQIDGVPLLTGPGSASAYLERLTASTVSPTYVQRVYTPPRYRIHTNLGQWDLRQRQTPAGVAGGWPLRHKQNGGASGAWPLRHR